MSSQLKACPRCHTSAPVTALYCSQCGHAFRTQFDGATPTQPITSPSLACTVCGNDQVQKVSAICNAGSWSSNSVGVSLGGGHIQGGPNFGTVGTSVGKTAGVTGLARMLTPPAKPRPIGSGGCGLAVLICLAGMFGLAALGTLTPGETQSPAGGFVLLLLTGGCGWGAWVVYSQDRRQAPEVQARNQDQIARWEHAMILWQALFYCPRCDVVFNPQTRVSAPPQAMHHLLDYSPAAWATPASPRPKPPSEPNAAGTDEWSPGLLKMRTGLLVALAVLLMLIVSWVAALAPRGSRAGSAVAGSRSEGGMVRCDLCGGSGAAPHFSHTGSGRDPGQYWVDSYITCPACGGSGLVRAGYYRR